MLKKIRIFLPPYLLQNLIWILTRIIFKIFIGHYIHGIENLKGIKKAIFATNHSSEIDPILIPASLSMFSRFSPTFYVSREKSFYTNSGWRKIIYGGLFFELWGAYKVYVGQNDFSKALNHHIDIINMGGSLCIFPEGKRTRDGNIHEGKGGVGYLFVRTHTPIVPVYIRGAFDLGFKNFFLRKNKVDIYFGHPIFPTEKHSVDYAESKRIAQIVMEKIIGIKKSLNSTTL